MKFLKYLRYVGHQCWYFFCCCILVGGAVAYTRVKVYGNKNVPKKGTFLLLANHQSFFDPMFCQWAMLPRFIWHVARDTLYTQKIFGWFLSTVNTIPIKRGEADLTSMRKILATLGKGYPVCLYPEATRTADGRIIDIKPGFSFLSRRSKADVLPVAIEGAYEMWPRDSKWPKPKKVMLCIGEVIPYEKVKELGDEKFAKLLTSELRRMQNELRVKMGREPFDYPTDVEA